MATDGLERWRRRQRQRELASDGRAGSWARRKARDERWAYMRSEWWLIPLAVALILVPLAVVPFLHGAFLRGVWVGAVLAGVPIALWSMVVQSTGTGSIMMGDEAEQWTAQAIRKRRGWQLVNHCVVARGDIDHVALGPHGALVVETKWSAWPWDSPDGIQRQRKAAAQVQSNVRQLHNWSEFRRLGLPLTPVVVLWHGHTAAWAPERHVTQIDGITVVVGRSFRQWLDTLPHNPAVTPERIEQAWTLLDAQTITRETYDGVTSTPLTFGQICLRAGVFIFASMLGFESVAIPANLLEVIPAIGVGSLVLLAAAGLRALPVTRVVWSGLAVGAGLPTLALAVAIVIVAVT